MSASAPSLGMHACGRRRPGAKTDAGTLMEVLHGAVDETVYHTEEDAPEPAKGSPPSSVAPSVFTDTAGPPNVNAAEELKALLDGAPCKVTMACLIHVSAALARVTDAGPVQENEVITTATWQPRRAHVATT
jgi:hypothetical protein